MAEGMRSRRGELQTGRTRRRLAVQERLARRHQRENVASSNMTLQDDGKLFCVTCSDYVLNMEKSSPPGAGISFTSSACPGGKPPSGAATARKSQMRVENSARQPALRAAASWTLTHAPSQCISRRRTWAPIQKPHTDPLPAMSSLGGQPTLYRQSK